MNKCLLYSSVITGFLLLLIIYNKYKSKIKYFIFMHFFGNYNFNIKSWF